MKPHFFEDLPVEIISDILLKLSVRTIAVSKCVCKSWLKLLESDGFISSHFAQTAPALALTMRTRDSNRLKLFELEEDELDLDLDRRDPLTRFAFPYNSSIGGSADGLLFLVGVDRGYLYICNPITREYIEICCSGAWLWGFGVSTKSGRHKVVAIEFICEGDYQFRCHVYTLGTGSWRLVEATDSFLGKLHEVGALVRGNLHWMVSDDRHTDHTERISCFDLETEHFSRFTVPPIPRSDFGRQLYNLRGSLAFCDGLFDDCEVTIWMMKEYGVEKSWTKEYVIDLDLGDLDIDWVRPIRVYENGDVLWQIEKTFYHYSKKTKSSQEIRGLFDAVEELDYKYMRSILQTPSMVSLKKCFGSVEKVSSF